MNDKLRKAVITNLWGVSFALFLTFGCSLVVYWKLSPAIDATLKNRPPIEAAEILADLCHNFVDCFGGFCLMLAGFWALAFVAYKRLPPK